MFAQVNAYLIKKSDWTNFVQSSTKSALGGGSAARESAIDQGKRAALVVEESMVLD